MASLSEIMRDDSRVDAIVRDTSVGHKPTARRLREEGIDTTEQSVRRARKWLSREEEIHTPPKAKVDEAVSSLVGKGNAEQTSEYITFHGVVLDQNCQDAEDWGPIFKIFGFSVDHFVIVDDTVKISTWQQSKRLENGDRDTVQLWAHSARFRRISKDAIAPATIKAWKQALFETTYSSAGAALGAVGTYLVLVADPQLGKKGTAEAVANWKRGVTKHCEAIHALRFSGRPVEAIHVAFMGDESEGVCNNYGNQPHTVELNLTAQLELDFDMRMWTLREFAKFGIPLSASSVISNHGEWTRNGSKDVVTTRGDNASTHIARQVKKVFDEMEIFGGPHIEWTIGGGEPFVIVRLSGMDCYFSHGYIEKGKGASTEIRTKSAIERQILGRTDALGNLLLWFMAHYHHFYMQEFEGRTLFGLPALEAERSSEYMLDQYGVWSPPGMLGVLIGADKKRGWSDLNVF